ncbi:hypothetical protein GGI22_007746, partial [Coemansia erecta]
APIPVRVRSQAYATYHHHTNGRGSGLHINGLESPQPPYTAPAAPLSQSKTPDSERMQNDAGSPAMMESVGKQNASMPRPPVQAMFSVRSETEVASLSVERHLGSSSPHRPLFTLSPVPKSAANGGSANATGSAALAGPVTTATAVSGTFVESENKDDNGDDEAEDGNGCKLVGNHGIVDLDGEVVELGPIKVECLPNLVTVICPPWLNESHLSRVSSMPPVKVLDDPIKGSLSREGSVLSFNNV